MNEKIKQQIEEAAWKYDENYKLDCYSAAELFRDGAEWYHNNIKESVNEKRYSDEEVKELMFETYLNTPKYVNPHAISIWIDSRVSASNQENNEGEKCEHKHIMYINEDLGYLCTECRKFNIKRN